MTPIEKLYFLGYSLKKRLVLRDQKRLPHPVISIGNLTVGGTGKTPATIAIAEEASKRGHYPIILTRGYKGQARGPCFVSKGCGRLLSVSDAGDEPAFMAERLHDAAIVKSADRFAGGMFAIGNLDLGGRRPVFILDDGFQHWKLIRDIDIVLVDGINPFGNRRLVPLGILRGPLEELNIADILVITKTKNEALAAELGAINPRVPLFFSDYRTIGLMSSEGNHTDMSFIEGKKAFAFSGIANPASFRETLKSAGCSLLEFMAYRDHYDYSRKDIDDLVSLANKFAAEVIITTEKDMVKIRELSNLPANLYALEIGFNIDVEFYDEVFSRLK